MRKREAPVLILYPATRPYVRYVVVVPKGKIYDQLMLDCIAGVVAQFGICICATCSVQNDDRAA